jgi:hypothetical protein
MGWLSVTSILLCDSEVKKRSWRRKQMYSEQKQSRNESDGNGCMDGYNCWLGLAGGHSRLHGNGWAKAKKHHMR